MHLSRLLPNGRSLFVLAGIVAVATLAFLLSMSTSLFAVRELDVSGAPAGVAADVRAALQETRGSSLVGLDVERLEGLVEAIPAVAAVSFDRAFPHTLRVRVVPERVVGVVRQGTAAFLVSARGRVVGRVERGASRSLPRIWAQRTDALTPGALVPATILPAVKAVSPLRRVGFPTRVATVRIEQDELHLRLGSGLDVRLGTADDVLVKLAVAGRVLPLLGSGTTYLDVSVPERSVAGSPAAIQAAEEARARAEAEAAALRAASQPAPTDATGAGETPATADATGADGAGTTPAADAVEATAAPAQTLDLE